MSRSFHLFWIAGFIGSAGGQFTAVALPWLVLQMTGSATLVGTAFAVMAAPAAIMSLLGGALADRYSPKALMIAARLLACGAACILGVSVLMDAASLPAIYAAGVLFSLSEATAMPAGFALAPRLMPPEQYKRGNALMMGSAQLANIGGPGAAGMLLAALTLIPPGADEAAQHAARVWATGYLFLITAATELIGVLLVAGIHAPQVARSSEPLLRAIGQGFSAMWNNGPVRLMTGMMLLAMALIAASMVGIPLMVQQRMGESPLALGGLMSAVSAGSLLGTLLAGTSPPLSDRMIGRLFLWSTLVLGGMFAAMAVMHSAWTAGACLLANGVVAGFSGVFTMSYMQRVLPQELMGRIASIAMFGMAVVRAPALLLAGVVAEIGLGWLFAGGGLLVAAVALLLILRGAERVFESQTG